MNLHHLELFYYVAKHGGIMEAVRNIPYGVQQPAVSGQIAQLEQDLGQRLFIRRPFALTAGGAELFDFIRPFFDNLEPMEAKLRGTVNERLRFAGPTLVLRHHLPALLAGLRRQYPQLRFELREGSQTEVEKALQNQEVDLGVTLLEGKVAPGLESAPLVKLQLVLLLAEGRPEQTAEDILKRDLLQETLISFPASEAICRRFREHLVLRSLDWPTGIELSSLDLIETYVSQGLGIGLSVQIPGESVPPGIRELPLTGIPPVQVGVLWRPPLNPITATLLQKVQQRAREIGSTKVPVDARARTPKTGKTSYRRGGIA